jgi:hypothetical protein
VNASANTVSATTVQFSDFSIFGEVPAVQSENSASPANGGSGGGRRGSPGRGGIAKPLNDLRQAVSSTGLAHAEPPSDLQLRTCERVMKWFRGNQKMLDRVNARLEKRFGFRCSE